MCSHPGGRLHQEDALLADDRLGLFAVADGMGASVSGRPAADLAIEVLRRQILTTGTTLESGVEAANAAIWERSEAAVRHQEEHRLGRVEPDGALLCWVGMGSTLVALRISEGRARVAHVGDSRAYRYSGGELTQLTTDHRLIDEARRYGVPESAIAELPEGVICRSLGAAAPVQVDTSSVPAAPGDVFLLASDGLTNALSNEAITTLLRAHADDPLSAVTALVEQAVARREGEKTDNVTVIVILVDPGQTPLTATLAAHRKEDRPPEGARARGRSDMEWRTLIRLLTPTCMNALERAVADTAAQRQFEVTIEHLLLALLEDPGADATQLLQQTPIGVGPVVTALRLLLATKPTNNPGKPTFHPQLRDLLDDTWRRVSDPLGHGWIRSGAMLPLLARTTDVYVRGAHRLAAHLQHVRDLDVTSCSASKEAQEASKSAPQAPPPLLPRETLSHQVREGETLLVIARLYAIDVEELARANDLGIQDALRPGTVLRLRVLSRHVVPRGPAA